jgi:hypothetical protein
MRIVRFATTASFFIKTPTGVGPTSIRRLDRLGTSTPARTTLAPPKFRLRNSDCSLGRGGSVSTRHGSLTCSNRRTKQGVRSSANWRARIAWCRTSRRARSSATRTLSTCDRLRSIRQRSTSRCCPAPTSRSPNGSVYAHSSGPLGARRRGSPFVLGSTTDRYFSDRAYRASKSATASRAILRCPPLSALARAPLNRPVRCARSSPGPRALGGGCSGRRRP